MFVSTLTYRVPLDQIDAALPDHIAWLDREYADGVAVLSGRQHPRVGGVILWQGITRAEVEDRVGADPFVSRSLAEVTIVEFIPTKAADALSSFLEQPV